MNNLKKYIWNGGFPILVILAWVFMMFMTLSKGYIHIPEILLSSSIAAALLGIGFFFYNQRNS